jgi:hypothetical protein
MGAARTRGREREKEGERVIERMSQQEEVDEWMN